MAGKLFAVPTMDGRDVLWANAAQMWCEYHLRESVAKLNDDWGRSETFEGFCLSLGFRIRPDGTTAQCIGCKREAYEAELVASLLPPSPAAALAGATSVGRLSPSDSRLATLAEEKPEYVDLVVGAKWARKLLAEQFPGTKFSIRTSRYAGGCSTRVSWVDGPKVKEVDAAIGWMVGSSFDGMIDLKSYHTTEHEGRRYSFSNDYMFTERRYSKELMQGAIDAVLVKYGSFLKVEASEPLKYSGSHAIFPAGTLYTGEAEMVERGIREWLEGNAWD